MFSLAQVLTDHARKYPKMQCRDAVKLLYQNEFGGGHLIRDEEACLNYLHREYAAVPQKARIPLTEDIGNGTVRVQLAALDVCGYTPEALGRDFIRSAALCQGSMERFLEKLSLLQKLTSEGRMPFSSQELEEYLTDYKAAGCPAVSHSDVYRRAYAPAYRVLLRSCLPEHWK